MGDECGGTCSGAEVPKDPSGREVLDCFQGHDEVLMGIPRDGGILKHRVDEPLAAAHQHTFESPTFVVLR